MRWSNAFRVVAALAIPILLAGPARSQQLPPDITVNEETKPKTVFQSLRDFTSYGASMGFMKVEGGDLGKNGHMRPLLQGVFRYRASDKWIAVGEAGYGWNSETGPGDQVVTFTFGTAGVARRFAQIYGLDLRASLGAGFYRWDFKNKGKSLLDSYVDAKGDTLGTQIPYRGISPGGYIGMEAERRIAQHVTVVALLQQHYIFTKDSTHYTQQFNMNHGFLGFRIGVNYHFSPEEGVLWERKVSKTIRLESGKEGK